MNVRINVSGCDDATVVDLELTESELATVQKVADAITAESGCICMPTMKVSVRAPQAEAIEAGETR